MKIKKIYEPVFKIWVAILVCPQSEFDKRTKMLNIDGVEVGKTDAGAVFKLLDDDGCNSFLVWFRSKPQFDGIVHESRHLADDILTSRGVEFKEDSCNEAHAYYQEFWVNKIKGAVK